MSAVVAIALPFFAVIAAGYAAGRQNLLLEADAAALQRFVFNVAMPAGLFGLAAAAKPLGPDDARVIAGYGAAALVTMASAYFLARFQFQRTHQTAAAQMLLSTLGNAVFLGLPIALSVPGWRDSYLLLLLFEGIIVFGGTAILLDPKTRENPLNIVLSPLRNPILGALFAGLCFSVLTHFSGWSLPAPAARTLSILGEAAGPTALVGLGLFLATTPTPSFKEIGGDVLAVGATKLLILPALALATMTLLGETDPVRLGPVLLFCATPSAVGGFILVSQYGVYEREAAAAVATTTVLSLLTVSTVLALYA